MLVLGDSLDMSHGYTVHSISDQRYLWPNNRGSPEKLKMIKSESEGVKEHFLHTEQRHVPQNGQADTG